MSILATFKQILPLAGWLLLLLVTLAEASFAGPVIPIDYAFALAITMALMIMLVWVISPLIAARMYRERITDLESRLRALECKYELLQAENVSLMKINADHARNLEDAYEYIRRLEAKYAGQDTDS